MQSQTLISIIVWLALLCSSRVVSDVWSDVQKWELANELNMLVHHSGWRLMEDVKIFKRKREQVVDPISEILESVSSNREPVNEFNVLQRHKEIWTVLMCKYSEIIFNYKQFINSFIRICQMEKSRFDSPRQYYHCFDSLLTKIHIVTPRFQCMTDALDFMHKMGPQSRHSYILPGVQKLTDYTSTLKPNTLSKLSERGTTVDVIDFEINAIGEYISGVFKKNLYWFTVDHCNGPRRKKPWSVQRLMGNFECAKHNQLIPQETTLVQYVLNEYDDFINEIMGKWFYDLGFGYGVQGKALIRTN